MQTIEGTPAFVHAGPFANIAHGNSSIVADQIALKLAGKDGFVLTESRLRRGHGHGEVHQHQVPLQRADAGLRRAGGHDPRAENARRRTQSGGRASRWRTRTWKRICALLEKGCSNLVEDDRQRAAFGVPVVVAINNFKTDTPARDRTGAEDRHAAGAEDAVMSDHWAQGGAGAVDLAKAVVGGVRQAAAISSSSIRWRCSIKEKIETIVARNVRRRRRGVFAGGGARRSSCTRARASTSCPSAWPRRT